MSKKKFFKVYCTENFDTVHVAADKVTAIRETKTRAGVLDKDAEAVACRVIHAGDLEVHTALEVDEIIDKIEKCLA